MENLSNLKKLDKDLKGIIIGHDLAREQRADRKKLIEIAKEKEAAEKEDFIYRVRGEPGNLRIIRIKKMF